MTAQNANTTADLFQATVLATAAAIARQFTSGDVENATKHLEAHLGELSAADAARFMATVNEFIQGTR